MTQNKPGLGERVRYWFDGWMSRGTGALIALLAIVTALLVVLVTLITVALHAYPEGQPKDFPDLLWATLMRAIDSGTLAGDNGWGYRATMLIITVAGIVIVASLISIISGAFDAKVEELRKGRSRVLETDHTLILGWSHKVFALVRELAIANESRGRSAIVILADRDKVEMEDEIRSEVGPTGRTKIVCRTGDPMNLRDLELGNPDAARSIIVLGSDGDDDPDSSVIKTTLALTNNRSRKPERYHIVGELRHGANLEAARLVGRDEAHWVLSLDLISRVTVQSCRQSGLSVVYSELLDFDGDELYFTDQPELHGRTFADARVRFSDATVIGIVTPDAVLINPPADTVYAAGAQLIVIAEDDSVIHLGEPLAPDESVIVAPQPYAPQPEHTVVLGVNAGLGVLLDELHSYVAPGSTVTVVADQKAPSLPEYDGMTVDYRRADPTQRRVLDALAISPDDHVIVLAARETLSAQRADAKTLVTLLHLREIADEQGVQLGIVSEMLDDRNRELAEVTRADDFIVSEKLVSLMLSQVSENERLSDVFGVLFDSAGSEVYIRPAELYIREGAEADFFTVIEAAARVGETAIGYRVAADAHDASAAYGVHLNPPKGDRVTFAPGDRVIVLAEE